MLYYTVNLAKAEKTNTQVLQSGGNQRNKRRKKSPENKKQN
jgi:hypothetical protein